MSLKAQSTSAASVSNERERSVHSIPLSNPHSDSPIFYRCSLACFKEHAATHGDHVPENRSDASKTDTGHSSVAEPSQQGSSTSGDPLLDFANSKDLQDLFRSNPDLRGQLRSIHEAVRRSENAADSSVLAQRARRKTPWQRPDNLERGMRELRAAIENSDPRSDALRSLVDIINKRATGIPGPEPLEENMEL